MSTPKRLQIIGEFGGSGGGGSVDVVTYNLVELGLPNLMANGDDLVWETDTTQITTAMRTDIVQFIINIEYEGLVFSNVPVTFAPGCSVTFFSLAAIMFRIYVVVNEGNIKFNAVWYRDYPHYGPSDNNKILQVVDGNPMWLTVENSAIKTYIDNYISSALEGDY